MDMDMQFYWGLSLILGFFLLYVAVTGDAQERAKQIDKLREDIRSGSLGGTTATSRRCCRNRTRRAGGPRRHVR